MTIEYAWRYLITHCLNESVMGDDETAKEAVDRIENAVVPLIAAESMEEDAG